MKRAIEMLPEWQLAAGRDARVLTIASTLAERWLLVVEAALDCWMTMSMIEMEIFVRMDV